MGVNSFCSASAGTYPTYPLSYRNILEMMEQSVALFKSPQGQLQAVRQGRTVFNLGVLETV